MYVDPRGPRFGAALTTVVLAVVLLTGSGWLLAAQAVVFGIGVVAGLRWAPYGLLYRRLVRPRLGPPAQLEAEAPPRFAQGSDCCSRWSAPSATSPASRRSASSRLRWRWARRS